MRNIGRSTRGDHLLLQKHCTAATVNSPLCRQPVGNDTKAGGRREAGAGTPAKMCVLYLSAQPVHPELGFKL